VALFGGILAVLTFLIVALYGIDRDIEKSAARLREIEGTVNATVGEKVLEWETRWGGSVTGYWGSAKQLLSGSDAH
jgi:hypothetical protein